MRGKFCGSCSDQPVCVWPLGAAGIDTFNTWISSARVGLTIMFLITAVSHFPPMKRDLIAMEPSGLPRPDLLVLMTASLKPWAQWDCSIRRLDNLGADRV